MRLFIASPVVLYDYTALRLDFDSVLEGKWVPEGSLHMTWVFLGECAAAEPVLARLQDLTPLMSNEPLVSLGTFGRPLRILYARSSSTALYDKAREFRRLGFEIKRFTPHATLCRVKKIYDYKKFKALMKKYEGQELGEIRQEIALYQSILSDKEASYTKIASIMN